MPPGTLGVQLCLNIQFVQYYMGILYFLDYFLTPITSATVISVHAKAHYGRAKITQWWECLPPRKWGLGSKTGIDTITWVALCSLHWNIIFSRLFNTYYFCNSYFCTCESALREIFLQVLWFSLLVFPFPSLSTFPDSNSTRNGRQRTKMWMCHL